ncbi:MAG: DUF885 domain-containing protein [Actinobacteria bacterium]|nr:DUF885 domain-containing protein [Actinomycetota bacterium]
MSQIFEIADRMVDETAAAEPIDATFVGVEGHDGEWGDQTIAGVEGLREMYARQLAEVRAVPESSDPWDRLAIDVLEESLSAGLASIDADERLRDLNSIASTLQDLRQVFDHMDTASAEGWEAIAARLEGLPEAIAGYRERLDEGRRRGLAAAVRQAAEAVRQCRTAAGTESPFDTMPGQFEGAGIGDASLAARVAAGVESAKAEFASLADYFEQQYLPDAPERDAVGRDRYVAFARRYLGTSIDPIRTYEWGWSEVGRLRAAMIGVAEQIVPGASLAEVLDLLATDADRAAGSPEEFRRLMAERQQIALDELDGSQFDVPDPIKAIDVKIAPPGGPLGAYYVGPSEDFARAGSVWFALGDATTIPMFDQVSTAYHEGFPGHHLQVGTQMAVADKTTRFHRLMVWYPGSGEGWALYAEDLMEELGYLEKPDYLMGKYASEMLRACRVVIDIGSHLELPIPSDQPFHSGEPWTYQRGVDMLVDYAAQLRPVAESEMNRYLGWPGQAISYKVGQQAIRDLRAEETVRLGADFDLKQFHARLLDVGSIGLDTLGAWMRRG